MADRRTALHAALGPPAALLPSARLAGWSLVLAGALCWPTWYLMPEPGTTDAAFILRAIAGQRGAVLLSAIVQTIGAVALVPAVLGIGVLRSRLAQIGGLLLLVGALGNAADAVYHQMAFEMTAANVDPIAMLPVMTRMQTVQVWLLVPLLVAFFPGAACFCLGLARDERVPRGAGWLFAAALTVGAGGAAIAHALGASPRPLTLTAFALFSAAIAWTGWCLTRPAPEVLPASAWPWPPAVS